MSTHTTRYTARCAEDVLAVVPVILGFEPEESLVMLTFGGREPFHARIDLPPPEGIDACVTALLDPALRHGVQHVVFTLFSGRDRLVRSVARALDRRFAAAGVRVVDVIQAHDGRWFTPLGRSGVPVHGVPYDVSDHPFRVQAVVDGQVTASSRRELGERLRADRAGVAGVEAALVALWEGLPAAVRRALERPASARETRDLLSRVRPDGPALRAMLAPHLRAGTTLDDREAALVLLAVHNAAIRDHAWFGMRRAEAVHHVDLWTDLVRRAPDGLVAGAAGVLAFAAWMHGDGALAWCAVDRCLADDPDHSLGRLVAEALERAVPPWEDWPTGGPVTVFSPGMAG
jgi:hypothetical protein